MPDTWLGRFRIDGVNHEGRRWYLAKGGVSLAREINVLYPKRTGLDGTVASAGHDDRSPRSDHRPHPYDASPAVVRAIDVGEAVENDGAALFELLRQTQDPRIKYGLHEDLIFSSYARGTRDPWEVHTQSVGHYGHVHVSLTSLADEDSSPRNLKGDEMVTRHSKADDGQDSLRANYDKAVAAGVFSDATQPGGVAFNDEVATFLERSGVLDLPALLERVEALEARESGDGLQRGDSVTLT